MTSSDQGSPTPLEARAERVEQMVRHWNPPPRDQLPPDVHVERLPFYGDTWYKRGIAYWLRRILGGVLILGTAALMLTLSVLIGKGIDSASRTGFHVVFILWVLYSAATFYRQVSKHLRFRRDIDQLRKVKPFPKWGFRAARGGAGLGILAAAGSGLLAVIYSLLAVATFGIILAVVVVSFDPVVTLEWRARYDLAEDLEHAAFMDANAKKVPRRWRQERRKVQGRIERGDYDTKPYHPF